MRRLWAMIGMALAFGPGAASAGPIEEAVQAARRDVEQGRCQQAYRRLAAVDGLESRARLVAGQCQIGQGLYPEALAELDRVRGAKDLTPTQVGDVELYRGIALYHLERYTEATAALDSADGLTSEEAQLALYRGLIALRNGDNDRAAPALESASRLAPTVTEPVASYYAGLAWQGASERGKAREAFQRVIAVDGDGPWGREAAKLLESTELFPFYVRGGIGIEYDDNVILRGGVNQGEFQNVPGFNDEGEKDWRGVWWVDAGVQVFSEGDWSGGLIGGYSGNAQFDLTEFDTHYPTVGGYLANRLGTNTLAQARYQFGYAWVNEDSFMRSQIVELGLDHTWPKAGTTYLVADVLWNDLRYKTANDPSEGSAGPGSPCVDDPPDTPLPPPGFGCGPAGVDQGRQRDRDGTGYGAAIEHRYLLPLSESVREILEEIEVAAGYRFRYYDSDGSEWEHFSHILSAGLRFELPLDFRLRTGASYEARDFDNPSSYPDNQIDNQEYFLSSVDREEHEVVFQVELEKDLTENLSVSARWSYIDNESNRRVYDYTRNIVGGYLNFRFD